MTNHRFVGEDCIGNFPQYKMVLQAVSELRGKIGCPPDNQAENFGCLPHLLIVLIMFCSEIGYKFHFNGNLDDFNDFLYTCVNYFWQPK